MKEYMKQICGQYASEKNFSGVCVLKRGGEVIFEGAYGYANRAFEIPNRIDTRFDTASITKIFTATAVLQLVQQGKLSLTDRICGVLDLSGTRIPEDVTIEQLLNHTSGIADDADEEAGEDYAALFVDSPNYAIRECRDFLRNFAYKEPNFKAGTDVRYCNCSYVLLGLALEAVTGMNFRDYYRQNIFRKAGMSATDFLSMDGINPNTAEGYTTVEEEKDADDPADAAGVEMEQAGEKQRKQTVTYRKNIYCYPPCGTPDGGACTTAEDLGKFLQAVRGHVLLNEEYAEMLLHPHCAFTKKEDWYEIPGMYEQNGYAFEFFMLEGQKEPFCIYKDGSNDGVSCKFSYYPEKDITLTILANQDCNVWAMTKEIQLELYRRLY